MLYLIKPFKPYKPIVFPEDHYWKADNGDRYYRARQSKYYKKISIVNNIQSTITLGQIQKIFKSLNYKTMYKKRKK